MQCPYCGYLNDHVVDSRESKDHQVVRRRRECLSCHHRFTTYESLENIPYFAVKRNGQRELFDRNKVMSGLMKATHKRRVAAGELDRIVDEVERVLHAQEGRELSTEAIGQIVMDQLKDLDKVAYVRFASVYRHFEDIDEFMDELKTLLHQR
jgi:transcriptional repressor NrdR